jgi:hypothetical protein
MILEAANMQVSRLKRVKQCTRGGRSSSSCYRNYMLGNQDLIPQYVFTHARAHALRTWHMALDVAPRPCTKREEPQQCESSRRDRHNNKTFRHPDLDLSADCFDSQNLDARVNLSRGVDRSLPQRHCGASAQAANHDCMRPGRTRA